MSIDNQSEYWDRVAWEKTFCVPLDLDRFASLVAPSQRVLDYGCGYGRLTGELAGHGYQKLIGVDSSGEMIERARREHPDMDFRVLDSAPLPLEDASIDAVLLFAVLTSVPTNEAQRGIMSEIIRVLRPGGILHIGDYCLQSDERNLARYRESQNEFGVYGIFRHHEEGAVLRHHDMEWIQSLTADLQQIELYEIDIVTMNGNPARAFSYIGRKA